MFSFVNHFRRLSILDLVNYHKVPVWENCCTSNLNLYSILHSIAMFVKLLVYLDKIFPGTSLHQNTPTNNLWQIGIFFSRLCLELFIYVIFKTLQRVNLYFAGVMDSTQLTQQPILSTLSFKILVYIQNYPGYYLQ